MVARLALKAVEHMDTDKTYCANPRCSLYLPRLSNMPESELGLHCGACDTRTCVRCKEISHGNGDCMGDRGADQTIALALAEGWQRCFRCHSIVERNGGCPHMM